MVEPFFISPFFIEYVLPFVLVFTLIFAVLQKTKLLGDNTQQIDAIIGLVIGLFLIAFPAARDIVVLLMPFLAILLVILFVFLLLIGFVTGDKDGDPLKNKWLKIVVGGIVVVSLIAFLLIITGQWNFIIDYLFYSNSGRTILINAVLIIIIAGAIVAVLLGSKDK